MRRISKKKLVAGAAAAAIIAGGAGVAFAYWTSTGTGSGSATTGTSTTWDVALGSVNAPNGPLTPGGPSETVHVTVTNNSSGHQQLNNLTVAVANSDGTAWTAVTGCSAADYAPTIPSVPANTDLGPGDTYETDITISMNDLASNQNGCKNATVPLYVSAS
jgi:hypothetical protein